MGITIMILLTIMKDASPATDADEIERIEMDQTVILTILSLPNALKVERFIAETARYGRSTRIR